MKTTFSPAVWLAVWLAAASLWVAMPVGGQTSSGLPPVSSQTLQETQQKQARKGKVILQRSIDADGRDENGQTTDGATPGKAQDQTKEPSVPVVVNADPRTGKAPVALGTVNGANGANGPVVSDAERSALSFTDFDLDVRLRPAEGYLAVRALVIVRNGGNASLTRLPLQLSSTLNWEQIRIIGQAGGQAAPFTVAVLNSDTDHTGQLHEATVTLAQPLAPGASLQLDVTYSGTVALSAKRLLAIGTPQDVAEHSDWDRISADFTGLRGFGNVVWYPASAPPVILGDGARLFDEIGTHKLKLAGSHFRMGLTVEIAPGGSVPNIALINGHPAALAVVAASDATVATIATAKAEDATLGFEAPSLFLANRTSHAVTNATLWMRPESEKNLATWANSAADVTPFLQRWLGKSPRSQLTILDLPEDGDIPFETAAMLATPIRAVAPEVLDGVLAHALTHAWVMSPRAWMSEGVAHFMGTLWIEKRDGRERALAALDNARPALALAEPESPGAGDGQPLVACISPVYYRTKAAYVFWMLRDLVGDATLSAALRAYDPAKDAGADSFETLLEQAGQRHDLKWFFADWVYADKGLPDLSIETVYPSPAAVAGSYLVAVNMANNGYASVEAPVQVISDSASVTQRVMLQARSKAVQRILIQGTPTEVRLNDGTIPETQATIHIKTLEAAPPKP